MKKNLERGTGVKKHGWVGQGKSRLSEQGFLGLWGSLLPAISRNTLPVLDLSDHSMGSGIEKDFARGQTSDTRERRHVTVTSGLGWESRGAPAYPAWGQARSCLTKALGKCQMRGSKSPWTRIFVTPAPRLRSLGNPGGLSQRHCSLRDAYI